MEAYSPAPDPGSAAAEGSAAAGGAAASAPSSSAAGGAEPASIARAAPADITAVEALLTEAGLTLDGVNEAFATGMVARQGGTIVGAAAVEPYGRDGLLRSVVVAPRVRGTGLGRALVRASEAMATDLGIRDLYLLTETAIEWFPRLGYEPLPRSEAPPGIAGSREFSVVCAETGVLMRRRLAG